MAECLLVPNATYVQYREIDGERVEEKLTGYGPRPVAHLHKLFANSTDDGELTLKVDGGADHGVVHLVRENGMLFMRSRNLDEPDAADGGVSEFSVFVFVEMAKQGLLAKMQEMSERLYSGQWVGTDLEYDLFSAVIKVDNVDNRFPEEDVAQLVRLYTAAGGWYYYQVGVGLSFTPLDEWRHKYSHRGKHT